MALRDYQNAAAKAMAGSFVNDKNPLVQVPTGGGKSWIIADIAKILNELDLRCSIVTHSQELVQQNADAFERHSGVRPGIVSSSLRRYDWDHPINFCSIQTIYDKGDKLGDRRVILIDEAHAVPDDEDAMYQQLFAKIRETSRDLLIGGFSATPWRKGRSLVGPDKLFSEICYKVEIKTLIDQGHLCRLVTHGTNKHVDLSNVKSQQGDYAINQLADVMDNDDVTEPAIDEVVERGADRRGWIAFCVNIEHANHVRDAFRKRGITCESIHSDMTAEERADIIRNYKAQKIQCLTNVNVLTTGFDAPHTDLLVMLRPTQSENLYVQMLGRGMRPSEVTGKVDCLVLDFAQNIERHGPVDLVDPDAPQGEKGQTPVKVCPQCKTYLLAGARTCECGFEFEMAEKASFVPASKSTTASVLSPEFELDEELIADGWVVCENVHYTVKQSERGEDYLQAGYNGGKIKKCVSFGSKAQIYTKKFFQEHLHRGVPYPKSAQEALTLSRTFKKPLAIRVVRDGMSQNVDQYFFD